MCVCNRSSVCLLFWFNSFAKAHGGIGVRGIGQWETNCRRLKGARARPGGGFLPLLGESIRGLVEKSKHSTRARTWRSRALDDETRRSRRENENARVECSDKRIATTRETMRFRFLLLLHTSSSSSLLQHPLTERERERSVTRPSVLSFA